MNWLSLVSLGFFPLILWSHLSFAWNELIRIVLIVMFGCFFDSFLFVWIYILSCDFFIVRMSVEGEIFRKNDFFDAWWMWNWFDRVVIREKSPFFLLLLLCSLNWFSWIVVSYTIHLSLLLTFIYYFVYSGNERT